MKIKSIFASLLVILAMTACSDDNNEPVIPDNGDVQTAYLSVRITPPTKATTRAGSIEDDGLPAESVINSLYIITFDENKKVVKHSQQPSAVLTMYSDAFETSQTGVTTPEHAFKINPDTKYLLVVANPGPKLVEHLGTLMVDNTFADFNKIIEVDEPSSEDYAELVNELTTTEKGFTMINAGGIDDGGNPAVALEDCLVDVSGAIVTGSEATAKTTAEENPASLTIERLAAKVQVSVAASPTILPTGAAFTLLGWELDYRNSKFFPYAKKTGIEATHAAGGIYANNFYTVDPNFEENDIYTGIFNNKPITERESTNPITWNVADAVDYCIENTMLATEQRFGSATRLVIKANYSPFGINSLTKDWFSYGTHNFETLADLKAAYSAATIPGLVGACDNFLNAVNAKLTNQVADFASLTQTVLDGIEHGGEISKIDNCIRWYQGGINYYFYEIRHDNSKEDDMYYGKYGVVRNNWYALTLNKVNGKGTPWYPGGGPGDPEEEKPIDEGVAYLSFSIEVGPWLYWTTGFEI